MNHTSMNPPPADKQLFCSPTPETLSISQVQQFINNYVSYPMFNEWQQEWKGIISLRRASAVLLTFIQSFVLMVLTTIGLSNGARIIDQSYLVPCLVFAATQSFTLLLASSQSFFPPSPLPFPHIYHSLWSFSLYHTSTFIKGCVLYGMSATVSVVVFWHVASFPHGNLVMSEHLLPPLQIPVIAALIMGIVYSIYQQLTSSSLSLPFPSIYQSQLKRWKWAVVSEVPIAFLMTVCTTLCFILLATVGQAIGVSFVRTYTTHVWHWILSMFYLFITMWVTVYTWRLGQRVLEIKLTEPLWLSRQPALLLEKNGWLTFGATSSADINPIRLVAALTLCVSSSLHSPTLPPSSSVSASASIILHLAVLELWWILRIPQTSHECFYSEDIWPIVVGTCSHIINQQTQSLSPSPPVVSHVNAWVYDIPVLGTHIEALITSLLARHFPKYIIRYISFQQKFYYSLLTIWALRAMTCFLGRRMDGDGVGSGRVSTNGLRQYVISVISCDAALAHVALPLSLVSNPIITEQRWCARPYALSLSLHSAVWSVVIAHGPSLYDQVFPPPITDRLQSFQLLKKEF